MRKITFETPAGLIEGNTSGVSVSVDYPHLKKLSKIYPDSKNELLLIFVSEEHPGWVEIPCNDSYYPSSFYKIVDGES